MLDIVSMWKNPKMLAFTALTAGLYAALIFPSFQFSLFGGLADFGRVGIGVPVAFSFLFGPAAAWGAAVGNVIRDIATGQLNAASYFGFIGNFLVGYIPYKLWRAITSQKPDLHGLKKFGLFVGITLLACCLCGLVIGWGLFWLGWTPFMPTAFLIALSDALWAVVAGSIMLALTYRFVSKHKLLYADILHVTETRKAWSTIKTTAVIVALAAVLLCFAVGVAFNAGWAVLLPLVTVAVVAALVACR